MKRLTEKRNTGNVIPLRNAVCGIDLPYWALDKNGGNEVFLRGDAADKLASYEDTDLTPSDIADLRNELCLKCGRFKLAHEGACDGCRSRKE